MVVKNIECFNTEVIDEILKQLIDYNINYLLIKNEGYVELHFDKFIYNFFCLEYNVKDKELLPFVDSSIFLTKSKKNSKKIQPGLKKYNKSLIKNDNFKNKIRK